MTDHDRWYTTDDLARLLDIDPSSLRRWRTSSPPQGPPFVRVSPRKTLYDRGDVDMWIRNKRIVPKDIANSPITEENPIDIRTGHGNPVQEER